MNEAVTIDDIYDAYSQVGNLPHKKTAEQCQCSLKYQFLSYLKSWLTPTRYS